ncbi:hypothetical protein TNCV_1011161 [Trichonephila clavipes]|uniref:Uncharacterized protein n=1 Tax=Trichonephila clavipes TaxID=2585209 RepID=A0A8X7B9K0_TRICX|nr:hypothetical protein TNCV_1011161 [Trichonephila clavipes]
MLTLKRPPIGVVRKLEERTRQAFIHLLTGIVRNCCRLDHGTVGIDGRSIARSARVLVDGDSANYCNTRPSSSGVHPPAFLTSICLRYLKGSGVLHSLFNAYECDMVWTLPPRKVFLVHSLFYSSIAIVSAVYEVHIRIFLFHIIRNCYQMQFNMSALRNANLLACFIPPRLVGNVQTCSFFQAVITPYLGKSSLHIDDLNLWEVMIDDPN